MFGSSYGLHPFGRTSEVESQVSDTGEAVLAGVATLEAAAGVESGTITLSGSSSFEADSPYEELSFHQLVRREALEPNDVWLNWRVSPPNFSSDSSPRRVASNNYTTSMSYTVHDHPSPYSKLGAYGWNTRAGSLRSQSTQPGSTALSTVGCWIKTSSTDTTMFNLLDHDNGSGAGRDFKLMLGGSPKVAVFRKWFAGNTTTREITGTTPLNDGQWHLVLGVYDGTHMRLYVDGIEEGSLVIEGTPNTGSAYYYFGQSQFSSESYGYEGRVTDIFVINRAFDPLEAFRLFSRMTGAPEEWAQQVDFDPLLFPQHEEPTVIERDPDGYPRSGSRKQRYFGSQTWLRSDPPEERLPQDISGEGTLSGSSSLRVAFRPTWYEPFEDRPFDLYKGPNLNRWTGAALNFADNEAGSDETHIQWGGATTRAMVSRMQRVDDVDLQFDFWMLKNNATDPRHGITVMVGADPNQQTNVRYSNVGYYFHWRWQDSTINVYRRAPSSTLVASFPVPSELVYANNQWISMRWRSMGGKHELAFWSADEGQPEFQATFTDADPLPPGVVALSFYSGYTYDTYQWRLRNFWVRDPYIVGVARLLGQASISAISSEESVEFGVANLSGGGSLQATGRNVIPAVANLAGSFRTFSGHDGTPNLIPDMGGWFIPHLDEDSVGLAVQLLRDHSPKQRHFRQENANQRPVLVDDVRNGYATLRFDGSNDAMRQALHATEPNETTYFVVLHKRNTANGTWIFDKLPNQPGHYVRTYNSYARLNAGASLDSDTIVWAEDFKVVTFKVDGASSAIRHMGEMFGEGNAGTEGLAGLTLGARSDANGSGGTHIAADIAEFLVFNRALSEAEILQVEGYLASKWALDLRARALLSGKATFAAKGEIIRISPKITMQTRSRLQSEHDFGLKPSQIGGLRLWVSASDLYLQWFNDEDRLMSWASREGVSLALAQQTLGFQPRYRRGVANNGRDAVRFQGAQFMRTALQAASIQPNTTFIVSTVGGANQTLFDGAETNGVSRHAVLTNASGRVSVTAGGGTIQSNGSAPTGVELWTATFGYPDGTSIRRNAVPHATGDAGVHAWRGLTVGARFDGGSQYLNGDVVEILHFDRQLSDIELEFVEDYLIAKHGLPRSGGGNLSGRASIFARSAGEYLEGTATLTAVGAVIAYPSAQADGESEAIANLGYHAELQVDPIQGSSTVADADLGIYLLSAQPIECGSEIAARLDYLDGIVPLRAKSDGLTTIAPNISGFVSMRPQAIQGQTAFTNALLTYWKPMAPEPSQGSSSVVGDAEIYLLSGGQIECSSEVDAYLAGDYQYAIDIIGSSSMHLVMHVETYFLPGPIHGEATVVGTQFIIAPHDIDVDSIQGSTSFVAVGSGYLELNLSRGLSGQTVSTGGLTAPTGGYTGTHFEQAILGRPVIIGIFQTDRSRGDSEVLANLFINEGGQANCNSRVEAMLIMLHERYMEAITDGSQVTYTPMGYYDQNRSNILFEYPDYYRPQLPQYVFDQLGSPYGGGGVNRRENVPCGSKVLWADFWRRGDLEPQVIACDSGLGTYYPNGKNVHPLTAANNNSQVTGIIRSGWNRPAGWFVDSFFHSFNQMGLFARTSEVDDYHNYSRSYTRANLPPDHPQFNDEPRSGGWTTPFGTQVSSEQNAGQLYHEPIPDLDWFHGYCGTRFISTLDGSNSVDMDLELKNALRALIEGEAGVLANFIILRFRTMTVVGNASRVADRVAQIVGSTAKSPHDRVPFAKQPVRVAEELKRVKAAKTLYT